MDEAICRKPVVLLGDRDESFRRALALALGRLGVQVVEFTSGADLYVRALTSAPDLIVLDIELDEMDGFQVFARLRRKFPCSGSRIAFVTELDNPVVELACRESGAAGYLLKSRPLDELVARVKELVADVQLPNTPRGASAASTARAGSDDARVGRFGRLAAVASAWRSSRLRWAARIIAGCAACLILAVVVFGLLTRRAGAAGSTVRAQLVEQRVRSDSGRERPSSSGRRRRGSGLAKDGRRRATTMRVMPDSAVAAGAETLPMAPGSSAGGSGSAGAKNEILEGSESRSVATGQALAGTPAGDVDHGLTTAAKDTAGNVIARGSAGRRSYSTSPGKAGRPKKARERRSSENEKLFGDAGVIVPPGAVFDRLNSDRPELLLHALAGSGERPLVYTFRTVAPVEEIVRFYEEAIGDLRFKSRVVSMGGRFQGVERTVARGSTAIGDGGAAIFTLSRPGIDRARKSLIEETTVRVEMRRLSPAS
jgi:CheY-like chemotaxis protein